MIRDLQKVTVGERETSLLQIGRELFLIIFSIFFIGFMIWLELELELAELVWSSISGLL